MIRLFPSGFIALIILLFLYNPCVIAKQDSDSEIINVLIHLTSNNKRSYQAALNYTDSLQEAYGKRINIAIVANGSGIGFVNNKNSYTKQIQSLIQKGVQITACNKTIKQVRKNQELAIINGVTVIPNGIIEVVNLQRKGYLYLHP